MRKLIPRMRIPAPDGKPGKHSRNKLSVLLYAIAVPLAFASSWAADALYVAVAICG